MIGIIVLLALAAGAAASAARSRIRWAMFLSVCVGLGAAWAALWLWAEGLVGALIAVSVGSFMLSVVLWSAARVLADLDGGGA